MKKLLSIFFALLLWSVGITDAPAANRYATSGDVTTYATSTNGQLKLNDYIIDTPFSTSGGLGQIYFTNISSTFSSLPAGGTIWLDAANLPDLFSVYMTNETSGTTWSNGSSEANPVKIRPLGGQIKTIMTAASNTARLWLIADIEHLEINGFHESFPGMKYPWTGQLNGTFGFSWDGGTVLSQNPFQIMVDGTSVKSLKITNIEVSGGFCALRIIPGNTNFTMDRVTFDRLYLHDALDGEMFYVGQTTGTPYVKFKILNVKDVICARAAAEAIQLQHMFSDASEWSYQENFIIYAAGSKWKDAFQQFQDNGFQHVADEGKVKVRNGIIDGTPNSPFSIISSPGGTPTSEPVVFQNILVNDTRDLGVYGGSSMQYGVKYEFRDMYFRAANDTYNELTEAAVSNYFVSMNGTDENNWVNTTWDNSKPNLWESSSQIDDIIGSQQDNDMPAPDYNKGPFPGKTAEKFEVYSEEYPSWSSRTGDKVVYTSGDVVRRDLVGTGQRFYECILGHTSSGSTHPESDAVHWTLITWDSNCFPSYHASWTSGGTQNYYPCDDFRLTADSYWNLKGMGLRSNFRNTNTTTYQWYIDDNGDETGMKAVAGQVKPEFEKSTEDYGRYVRLKVYFKPSPGAIIEQWLGDWIEVE